MILVCGGIADTVTELVCARLEERAYPYRLLDMGVYPEGYRMEWRWRGPHPEGFIRAPGWKLDLGELTGAYVRYLGPEGRVPPAGLRAEQASFLSAECDSALALMLDNLACTVVNRMAGGMSNHSKPYQALLIRRSGLRIPPTLVTNDPDEARSFHDACGGEVIYKSLSGVRSIVRRVGPTQLARLSLLRHGPAQFQAFVPGENVRVHTVGDRLFATRIHSDAVDYRYAGREQLGMEMEPGTLPPAVEASCRFLARSMGLLLAGIDLKVTPEGEYYCFEVNPSPGFVFYELGDGQAISGALADLLHHGAPGTAQPPAPHGARAEEPAVSGF